MRALKEGDLKSSLFLKAYLDGLYLALSCQSRELQRSGTDSGDGSALSSLVSSAFGLTAVHR